MERVVLTAPTITSEQSIDAIGAALRGVETAHVAESNLQARQVTVEFAADRASLEQIKAVLEEAGFAVTASWAAPIRHEHGDGHGEAGAGVGLDDLVFSVRLLQDGVTAEVGYECPCGCTPQAR